MEKNDELQNYKDKIKEPKNFITENQYPTSEDLNKLVEELKKKNKLYIDLKKFNENNQGIKDHLTNLQESISVEKRKLESMKAEYQRESTSVQREREFYKKMMNRLKMEENQILSGLNSKRKRVEALKASIKKAKQEKEMDQKRDVEKGKSMLTSSMDSENSKRYSADLNRERRKLDSGKKKADDIDAKNQLALYLAEEFRYKLMSQKIEIRELENLIQDVSPENLIFVFQSLNQLLYRAPFMVSSEIQAAELTSFLLLKSESPNCDGVINLLKILIGQYNILSEESERNFLKSIKDIVLPNQEEIFKNLEEKGFISRKEISEVTGIKYDSFLDFIMMKLIEITGSMRGIQGKHLIELIKRKEVKFEDSLDQGVIYSEEEENNNQEKIYDDDDDDDENSHLDLNLDQFSNQNLEQFSDDDEEIQIY